MYDKSSATREDLLQQFRSFKMAKKRRPLRQDSRKSSPGKVGSLASPGGSFVVSLKAIPAGSFVASLQQLVSLQERAPPQGGSSSRSTTPVPSPRGRESVSEASGEISKSRPSSLPPPSRPVPPSPTRARLAQQSAVWRLGAGEGCGAPEAGADTEEVMLRSVVKMQELKHDIEITEEEQRVQEQKVVELESIVKNILAQQRREKQVSPPPTRPPPSPPSPRLGES